MDIVERLRDLEFIYYPNSSAEIAIEAANEIERLREALNKINDLLCKTVHIKERAKAARSVALEDLQQKESD